MEQLKLGEEPLQQQAALREQILDNVKSLKSAALEDLSHSFNQQEVQLHALMTNLHESVLCSLEKGMQEAEGRLQGRVAEMCAQSNCSIAAEDTESAGTKELRDMLEAERQDRSDLAEKQSDMLHGIVQELTDFKASAESRSQELEQLRAEVNVLRASDAVRQARIQDVVDAFGESLHGEREARERGDGELRDAISALQASAQQAPSSEQGISASMAEELRAFGRRMDDNEARLQQLADEAVRQACASAAGAVTCCQELAAQLESESTQRESEIARVGAELASDLGACREAASTEAARLRAELESTAADLREATERQSAAAHSALAEGLASLRATAEPASCAGAAGGSAAGAKDADFEALLLSRVEAQEKEHAELASALGACREAASSEAARLRAELESTAAALREAARSELGEAMQRQRAAAHSALAEGLASLRATLEPASCAGAAGGSAAGATGADLEAMLLSKVEAQEKEHAASLQELGELFLGELAGLRASTDEQCRLLLQELDGERETRGREFAEFRQALCSLTA